MTELEQRLCKAIKKGTIERVDQVPMNWRGALQTLIAKNVIEMNEGVLCLIEK